jgi:hypothetical protein
MKLDAFFGAFLTSLFAGFFAVFFAAFLAAFFFAILYLLDKSILAACSRPDDARAGFKPNRLLVGLSVPSGRKNTEAQTSVKERRKGDKGVESSRVHAAREEESPEFD